MHKIIVNCCCGEEKGGWGGIALGALTVGAVSFVVFGIASAIGVILVALIKTVLFVAGIVGGGLILYGAARYAIEQRRNAIELARPAYIPPKALQAQHAQHIEARRLDRAEVPQYTWK